MFSNSSNQSYDKVKPLKAIIALAFGPACLNFLYAPINFLNLDLRSAVGGDLTRSVGRLKWGPSGISYIEYPSDSVSSSSGWVDEVVGPVEVTMAHVAPTADELGGGGAGGVRDIRVLNSGLQTTWSGPRLTTGAGWLSSGARWTGSRDGGIPGHRRLLEIAIWNIATSDLLHSPHKIHP